MRLVVFVDADGTIWEVNPVKYALRDVAEFLAPEAGREADELWEELQLEQPKMQEKGLFLESYDWFSTVRSFAERIKKGSGDSAVSIFVEGVKRHSKAVKLVPGASAILRSLRDEGFRLVVLSNSYSFFVEEPLRASGLWDLFDGVVTPDIVASDRFFAPWAPPVKPFRPIYVYGLMKHAEGGIPIFVGDDYLKDGLAPLRSGFYKAIVFSEGFDASLFLKPDFVKRDGDVTVSPDKPIVVRGWTEAGEKIREIARSVT